MLDKQLINSLTTQAIHELAVSNFYVVVSNYFDSLGAMSLARYYADQAKEEREHADLFFEYLKKRGAEVKIFSVPAIEMEMAEGNGLEWVIYAASVERDNLDKIEKLVLKARDMADVAVEFFLIDILKDQVDEVDVSESLQELIFGKSDDGIDNLVEIDTWVKLNLLKE